MDREEREMERDERGGRDIGRRGGDREREEGGGEGGSERARKQQ